MIAMLIRMCMHSIPYRNLSLLLPTMNCFTHERETPFTTQSRVFEGRGGRFSSTWRVRNKYFVLRINLYCITIALSKLDEGQNQLKKQNFGRVWTIFWYTVCIVDGVTQDKLITGVYIIFDWCDTCLIGSRQSSFQRFPWTLLFPSLWLRCWPNLSVS